MFSVKSKKSMVFRFASIVMISVFLVSSIDAALLFAQGSNPYQNLAPQSSFRPSEKSDYPAAEWMRVDAAIGAKFLADRRGQGMEELNRDLIARFEARRRATRMEAWARDAIARGAVEFTDCVYGTTERGKELIAVYRMSGEPDTYYKITCRNGNDGDNYTFDKSASSKVFGLGRFGDVRNGIPVSSRHSSTGLASVFDPWGPEVTPLEEMYKVISAPDWQERQKTEPEAELVRQCAHLGEILKTIGGLIFEKEKDDDRPYVDTSIILMEGEGDRDLERCPVRMRKSNMKLRDRLTARYGLNDPLLRRIDFEAVHVGAHGLLTIPYLDDRVTRSNFEICFDENGYRRLGEDSFDNVQLKSIDKEEVRREADIYVLSNLETILADAGYREDGVLLLLRQATETILSRPARVYRERRTESELLKIGVKGEMVIISDIYHDLDAFEAALESIGGEGALGSKHLVMMGEVFGNDPEHTDSISRRRLDNAEALKFIIRIAQLKRDYPHNLHILGGGEAAAPLESYRKGHEPLAYVIDRFIDSIPLFAIADFGSRDNPERYLLSSQLNIYRGTHSNFEAASRLTENPRLIGSESDLESFIRQPAYRRLTSLAGAWGVMVERSGEAKATEKVSKELQKVLKNLECEGAIASAAGILTLGPDGPKRLGLSHNPAVPPVVLEYTDPAKMVHALRSNFSKSTSYLVLSKPETRKRRGGLGVEVATRIVSHVSNHERFYSSRYIQYLRGGPPYNHYGPKLAEMREGAETKTEGYLEGLLCELWENSFHRLESDIEELLRTAELGSNRECSDILKFAQRLKTRSRRLKALYAGSKKREEELARRKDDAANWDEGERDEFSRLEQRASLLSRRLDMLAQDLRSEIDWLKKKCAEPGFKEAVETQANRLASDPAMNTEKRVIAAIKSHRDGRTIEDRDLDRVIGYLSVAGRNIVDEGFIAEKLQYGKGIYVRPVLEDGGYEEVKGTMGYFVRKGSRLSGILASVRRELRAVLVRILCEESVQPYVADISIKGEKDDPKGQEVTVTFKGGRKSCEMILAVERKAGGILYKVSIGPFTDESGAIAYERGSEPSEIMLPGLANNMLRSLQAQDVWPGRQDEREAAGSIEGRVLLARMLANNDSRSVHHNAIKMAEKMADMMPKPDDVKNRCLAILGGLDQRCESARVLTDNILDMFRARRYILHEHCPWNIVRRLIEDKYKDISLIIDDSMLDEYDAMPRSSIALYALIDGILSAATPRMHRDIADREHTVTLRLMSLREPKALEIDLVFQRGTISPWLVEEGRGGIPSLFYVGSKSADAAYDIIAEDRGILEMRSRLRHWTSVTVTLPFEREEGGPIFKLSTAARSAAELENRLSDIVSPMTVYMGGDRQGVSDMDREFATEAARAFVTKSNISVMIGDDPVSVDLDLLGAFIERKREMEERGEATASLTIVGIEGTYQILSEDEIKRAVAAKEVPERYINLFLNRLGMKGDIRSLQPGAIEAKVREAGVNIISAPHDVTATVTSRFEKAPRRGRWIVDEMNKEKAEKDKPCLLVWVATGGRSLISRTFNYAQSLDLPRFLFTSREIADAAMVTEYRTEVDPHLLEDFDKLDPMIDGRFVVYAVDPKTGRLEKIRVDGVPGLERGSEDILAASPEGKVILVTSDPHGAMTNIYEMIRTLHDRPQVEVIIVGDKRDRRPGWSSPKSWGRERDIAGIQDILLMLAGLSKGKYLFHALAHAFRYGDEGIEALIDALDIDRELLEDFRKCSREKYREAGIDLLAERQAGNIARYGPRPGHEDELAALMLYLLFDGSQIDEMPLGYLYPLLDDVFAGICKEGGERFARKKLEGLDQRGRLFALGEDFRKLYEQMADRVRPRDFARTVLRADLYRTITPSRAERPNIFIIATLPWVMDHEKEGTLHEYEVRGEYFRHFLSRYGERVNREDCRDTKSDPNPANSIWTVRGYAATQFAQFAWDRLRYYIGSVIILPWERDDHDYYLEWIESNVAGGIYGIASLGERDLVGANFIGKEKAENWIYDYLGIRGQDIGGEHVSRREISEEARANLRGFGLDDSDYLVLGEKWYMKESGSRKIADAMAKDCAILSDGAAEKKDVDIFVAGHADIVGNFAGGKVIIEDPGYVRERGVGGFEDHGNMLAIMPDGKTLRISHRTLLELLREERYEPIRTRIDQRIGLVEMGYYRWPLPWNVIRLFPRLRKELAELLIEFRGADDARRVAAAEQRMIESDIDYVQLLTASPLFQDRMDASVRRGVAKALAEEGTAVVKLRGDDEPRSITIIDVLERCPRWVEMTKGHPLRVLTPARITAAESTNAATASIRQSASGRSSSANDVNPFNDIRHLVELGEADGVIANFVGVDLLPEEEVISKDVFRARRNLLANKIDHITLTEEDVEGFTSKFGGEVGLDKHSIRQPVILLSGSGARGTAFTVSGTPRELEGYTAVSLGDDSAVGEIAALVLRALSDAGLPAVAPENIRSGPYGVVVKLPEESSLADKRLAAARSIRRGIEEMKRRGRISQRADVASTEGAIYISPRSKAASAIEVIKTLGLKKVVIVGSFTGTRENPGVDMSLLSLTERDLAREGLGDVRLFKYYVGNEASPVIPHDVLRIRPRQRGEKSALELYRSILKGKSLIEIVFKIGELCFSRGRDPADILFIPETVFMGEGSLASYENIDFAGVRFRNDKVYIPCALGEDDTKYFSIVLDKRCFESRQVSMLRLQRVDMGKLSRLSAHHLRKHGEVLVGYERHSFESLIYQAGAALASNIHRRRLEDGSPSQLVDIGEADRVMVLGNIRMNTVCVDSALEHIGGERALEGNNHIILMGDIFESDRQAYDIAEYCDKCLQSANFLIRLAQLKRDHPNNFHILASDAERRYLIPKWQPSSSLRACVTALYGKEAVRAVDDFISSLPAFALVKKGADNYIISADLSLFRVKEMPPAAGLELDSVKISDIERAKFGEEEGLSSFSMLAPAVSPDEFEDILERTLSGLNCSHVITGDIFGLKTQSKTAELYDVTLGRLGGLNVPLAVKFSKRLIAIDSSSQRDPIHPVYLEIRSTAKKPIAIPISGLEAFLAMRFPGVSVIEHSYGPDWAPFENPRDSLKRDKKDSGFRFALIAAKRLEGFLPDYLVIGNDIDRIAALGGIEENTFQTIKRMRANIASTREAFLELRHLVEPSLSSLTVDSRHSLCMDFYNIFTGIEFNLGELSRMVREEFVAEAERRMQELPENRQSEVRALLPVMLARMARVERYCEDMIEFGHREAVRGSISRFADIEEAIKKEWPAPEYTLEIDDEALDEKIAVNISEDRLRHLVGDLIKSAFSRTPFKNKDYSQPGPLFAAKEKVVCRVSSFKEEGKVYFQVSVTDYGTGFTEEDFNGPPGGLMNMFELKQGYPSRRIGDKLAEVWSIVAVAGGTIEIESESEQFTIINVTIPAIEAASRGSSAGLDADAVSTRANIMDSVHTVNGIIYPAGDELKKLSEERLDKKRVEWGQQSILAGQAHLILVKKGLVSHYHPATSVHGYLQAWRDHFEKDTGYTVNLADDVDEAIAILYRNKDNNWDRSNTIIGVCDSGLDALTDQLRANKLTDAAKVLSIGTLGDGDPILANVYLNLMASLVNINEPLSDEEDAALIDRFRLLFEYLDADAAGVDKFINALKNADTFNKDVLLILRLPIIKPVDVEDLNRFYENTKPVSQAA